MKKLTILFIALLALVLLSAPAMAAASIPGDSNKDQTLTKDEMTSTVMSYLAGSAKLDDARDSAYVYSMWNGKPKSITDSANLTVTLYRPADKIIVLGSYRVEAVKLLGEEDRIIAIDTYTKNGYSPYYPELLDLPNVGTYSKPDYETIIAMNPDLVITTGSASYLAETNEKLGKFDIPVAALEFYKYQLIKPEIIKLGYLLDREGRAEEYVAWRDSQEKIITDYLKSHPGEAQPKAYVEMNMGGNMTWGKGSNEQAMFDICGCSNIARDLGEYSSLDMEFVIEQNPDIMIWEQSVTRQWGWNKTADPQQYVTMLEERPGWAYLNATKNDQVYVICNEAMIGPDSITGLAYFAKWMHPGIPIDPEQVYTEYLKTFLGVQYPESTIMGYPEP